MKRETCTCPAPRDGMTHASDCDAAYEPTDRQMITMALASIELAIKKSWDGEEHGRELWDAEATLRALLEDLA